MTSSIKESFVGKTILITGSSGFVGMVLTEKLLRDCDGIKKIFVIFRSKKGQDSNQRFQKFYEHFLFDKVRENGLLEKIQPMYGDLNKKIDAGISSENLELLRKNVNIVVHCAASIRFDNTLKDSVTLNTIGTKTMLDLAESFQNLEAFVHISTAYSNTNRDEIGEVIYEPIMDYRKVIKACEENDIDELQKIEKLVLNQNLVNTYVFSKNLTEKLISESGLPFIIVRPSIVTPSFEEPFPGWPGDHGLAGPIGILLGASLGICRTYYGNDEIYSDFMPVDMCANSIIAATSHLIRNQRNNNMRVINCTSSAQNSFTWNELLKIGKKSAIDIPSKNSVWYPGGFMTEYYPIFLIRFLIFQIFPSCLIDFFLMIFLRKPKFVKIQLKILAGMKVFKHFVTKQWIWKNDNFLNLFDQLSDEEKFVTKSEFFLLKILKFCVSFLGKCSTLTPGNWIIKNT
jgi:fatty acyl-CoA reductase